MTFAPIDPAIKDETIALVKQNKSLTEVQEELHKNGKDVSRSWVAKIARKYKKSQVVGAPSSQGPVGTVTSQQPVGGGGRGGGTSVSDNKMFEERRLELNRCEALANQQAQQLELLRQSLNQQAVQQDLRDHQQDQRQQQLTQHETQLQQQIADYNNEKERQRIEATAQLKTHQRKEAFLNSRFEDLLAREDNVAKYGSASLYIEELGFEGQEIVDFFLMVKNRAESSSSPKAVLVKIIEEFNDEDEVQLRLDNKNKELAAANQNLMYKQFLMMS